MQHVLVRHEGLVMTPSVSQPLPSDPLDPAVVLSVRYWYALLTIAGLLILNNLLVQPALSRLATDAPVINVAGRQRMLSQRLTKTALSLLLVSSNQEQADKLQSLRTILDEWKRAHLGLQHGDAGLKLPGGNSLVIQGAFQELDKTFQAIQMAAEDLIKQSPAGARPDTDPGSPLHTILREEPEFLTRMHAIVGLFEADARDHVHHLQNMGITITLAILCLLGVIQAVVVRPAMRLVRNRMRQQDERYRLLVESINDGLLLQDTQQRITFVNQRFCDWMGCRAEELLARHVLSLVNPADQRRYDALLLQAGKEHPFPSEIALRNHHGKVIETLISPHAIADESGEIIGILLVISDLTTRKEAERRSRALMEQLAHADRINIMGEMAAGLAHEINQPLGAVTNYASACLKALEDPQNTLEILRKPLENIQRAALRAGGIIRRIHGFAQQRPQPRDAELINQLVVEVEQLCLPEARLRQVTVELRLDEAISPMPVDGIQFQQVLTNLVQNALQALDATPAYKRRLVIQTRADPDGGVIVTVADNGPGIPLADRERIFETFYTTRPSGTGLGLSISRSIIAAHGGEMWIEDNPEGGAVFGFRLPGQPPQLAPVTETEVLHVG